MLSLFYKSCCCGQKRTMFCLPQYLSKALHLLHYLTFTWLLTNAWSTFSASLWDRMFLILTILQRWKKAVLETCFICESEDRSWSEITVWEPQHQLLQTEPWLRDFRKWWSCLFCTWTGPNPAAHSTSRTCSSQQRKRMFRPSLWFLKAVQSEGGPWVDLQWEAE